jgi:hypothetical protein
MRFAELVYRTLLPSIEGHDIETLGLGATGQGNHRDYTDLDLRACDAVFHLRSAGMGTPYRCVALVAAVRANPTATAFLISNTITPIDIDDVRVDDLGVFTTILRLPTTRNEMS